MRPTAGLVSRGGVYAGWPSVDGSLGPMARTVTDLAKLLDIMVGYDPDDPLTARGVGAHPASFTKFLDKTASKARASASCASPWAIDAEPDSEDFAKWTEVFDKAVSDLKAAGAEVIDPIVIPKLKELLAKRAAASPRRKNRLKNYFGRSRNRRSRPIAEAVASPEFAKVSRERPVR